MFWVLLYNGFIYPLVFVAALITSIFDEKLRKGIKGRFQSTSLLKQYFKEFNEPPSLYWFHAASLGEFHQVKPVIDGLKEVRDDIKIIVSFSSPSGYENSLNESIDLKIYAPFDFPWSIITALNIARPRKIIFASYDIWPNMIWLAKFKGIHTNIFATRVKHRSPKLRPLLKQFYRSIYASISSIYTVSEADSEGINTILGPNSIPIIKVLGNPRYDTVMKSSEDLSLQKTDSVLEREERIIIGSAHVEDDDFLIPALADLMEEHPDMKVLYAPHEPSRKAIDRISKRFKKLGYRNTIFAKKNDMTLSSDRLVIVGVVGVLSKLYWQGIIAFIGGGLSTGIHNVMEPAIAKLPVLFGPRYHHAHEAEELLKSGGGFCINGQNEFHDKIIQLINDRKYLKLTSLAATDVIHKNLGSSTRIIRNLLND